MPGDIFDSVRKYQFNVYSYPLVSELIWRLDTKDAGRLIVPRYQRPLVWTVEQKEQLIDSMVRGLPIGNIFLNRNEDWDFEIVDGQQRLFTVKEFMANEFAYHSVYYRDAKEFFDDRFSLFIMPTYVLEIKDKREIVELYKRINIGGTPHTVEELMRLDGDTSLAVKRKKMTLHRKPLEEESIRDILKAINLSDTENALVSMTADIVIIYKKKDY